MNHMAAELVQSPPDVKVYELDATHRCDRCSSRAYVRARLFGSELLFCGHHGREHTVKLGELGAEILDETDRILTS